MKGATLVVDLAALARNFVRLRGFLPGAELVPVLKGDAYGLGAAEACKALVGVGARRVWVETLDEASSLRARLEAASFDRGSPAGPTPDGERSPRGTEPGVRIGVLDGPPPGEAAAFTECGFEAAICDGGQLREWMPEPGASAGTCVLRVDTGFNRLGFRPDDDLIGDRALMRALRPRAWLTHLADGGAGRDSPRNVEQGEAIRRFEERLQGPFPEGLPLSLGLDGAVALRGRIDAAEIRSGAALFGVEVFPELLPLEGVARLDAPVLRVIEVPEGARVGYGSGWEARRPSRVAVLGIGYAHGVPRSLTGRGTVRFGEPDALPAAPVVGAISMELLACDVTLLPANETAPGTRGRLLDERYGINEMARDSGRLDTEILCALGTCPKAYLRSSL
ncbi:MAG: alanine racemase [Spirochaetales bacterium]|nr:alanine racemase [Spirochaetales bacterium]